MRVRPLAPISPRSLNRSSDDDSILLDYALAAGGLEAVAESAGFARGAKRPNKRAIEHTLRTQIGASDDWRAIAERAGILGLQRAERSLRFGFAFLRRQLNDVGAGAAIARRGGEARRWRSHRPLR